MKIDNAKFKQKVLPGDTIIFKLELISPIRRGLCHIMKRIRRWKNSCRSRFISSNSEK